MEPAFESAKKRYGMAPPLSREYQDCSRGLVDAQQKIRQPDGDGQQPENAAAADRRRHAASSAREGRMGSERTLTHEQRHVEDSLAPTRLRAEPVGVGVTAEQRHLEEEHAGGPDSGRSAEPGQNQFGDQRLHLKQQERAEQDGGGEERRGDAGFTCKRQRR